MKLYIGSDHRGFQLKKDIVNWLTAEGHNVVDCGNTKEDKEDDFPDYAFPVADQVSLEPGVQGIVLCGSGIGVAIAANKVPGIRAAVGHSAEEVKNARNDDDINILALSADHTNIDQAKNLITTFIETVFGSETRFHRRLEKIAFREMGSGGGCCGGGCC